MWLEQLPLKVESLVVSNFFIKVLHRVFNEVHIKITWEPKHRLKAKTQLMLWSHS